MSDNRREIRMNQRTWTAGLAVGALLMFTTPAWSGERKAETHLTMDQLPAAVKATIEKESAGAKVEEVEKETEHGKTFYEAEIVKRGRESFVHVSEDGKVLKRETEQQERKTEGAEKEEKGETHHR